MTAKLTPTCLSFLRRDLAEARFSAGGITHGFRCELYAGHAGNHYGTSERNCECWADEDADQCPAQSVEFNGMPIRCMLATNHAGMHEDGCVRWEDPKPDSELMVAAKVLFAMGSGENKRQALLRMTFALGLEDAREVIARLLVSGAVSEEELRKASQ